MYYNDLENRLFNSEHASISNKLHVISGYIGPELVLKCSEFPNKDFTIIYGMYGQESISKILHDKLVEIERSYPNIHILYSLVPVHSKIYCWSKDDVIVEILTGSANFSVSGLRKDIKETLYPISQLAHSDYISYRKYIENHSIKCVQATKFKHSVEIISPNSHPRLDEGICTASFLDSKGRLPNKSGLNWGYSNGNVKVGDAYIPIRVDYIKTFPNLFPPKKYVNGMINPNSKGKKTRANDEIEIIWDDRVSMIGLLEGNNDIDGVKYPNKICTSENKKILGDYIRGRLKAKLDKSLHNEIETKPITKEILTLYGRHTIDISIISEGVYYLDFSV